MAPPEKKHKRPVGAGLALDKFATLGVSKFDKRKKLERIKKQNLIKHSKYTKLKKKLEAQGVLSGAPVKDSVAELEALDGHAPSASGDGSDGTDSDVNEERTHSHDAAGPSSKPQSRSREEAPKRLKTAVTALPNGNRSRQGTPAVTAPVQTSRASGALGQLSNGVGRHPWEADQQGTRDRKRPRGSRDAAGPHEEPGPQNAPGRKLANLGAGRCEDGDIDKGPGSRSSVKQRAGATGGQRGGMASGMAEQEGRRGGDKRAEKPLSRLQRLAQQVAEEKTEKQRAKEEAMKEREERMKKVAAVEKARKEQKQLHFKRTAKGQPLMRYRMEKLLSQLEKTAE